jgi:hypothetical protein
MQPIQFSTMGRSADSYQGVEPRRVNRLVRTELFRSAGISITSMIIAATLGLISPLPALMFVAGSLLGHGVAVHCVAYGISRP